MAYTSLLHDLITRSAEAHGSRPALWSGVGDCSYEALHAVVQRVAHGLLDLGINRSERVAIYTEKRVEFVAASFGIAAAGAAFVPVNPLLKAEQVGYILRDCNVRVLITTADRLALLRDELLKCPDIRAVVVIDGGSSEAAGRHIASLSWQHLLEAPARPAHRVIDVDLLAILYTSGSTGRPKGVVLSHRNMVEGARSVSHYLGNHHEDVILAALPFSFDAGFSQMTTAFNVGAKVVLLNYLLPKDVINALAEHRVTGLTGVPPLWIQLAGAKWPPGITDHLRYIANTGGRMPRETLTKLRELLPLTKPFLMYGLTEAFRSTYLPPEEVDRRPDSIGKAIPGAEILVLRDDGTQCGPEEPGELVHRGALVGMGYWNDPEKTAERYKPLPNREGGFVLPEIAVFAGDTVRRDAEGFLYFIGRRDEMMKTSGYRVSPTEVEEAVYSTGLVGECAAFGVPHPTLGQAIVVVATPKDGGTLTPDELVTALRPHLPTYMVPAKIYVRHGPLPRNPNGKIDRKVLSAEFLDLYES